MFEDIMSGAGNVLGDLQLGVIGILAFMWAPFLLVWLGVTVAFGFFVFSRNIEIVHPSAWVWKVIIVKPYADGQVGKWFVPAARCSKNGLQRLKLGGVENFVMQKLDMKNIYRKNEVFVVSLGLVRKFYANVTTDFERKKLILSIDNPKMAQLYFADSLVEGDLNYLEGHIPLLNNLITYWSIATVLLGFSTFIVVYPWFLKGLGYGR